MTSRAGKRRALPAFAVIAVAAVVVSVFRAGSSGVESAESAARIPIPARQTVHLDARGYTVSFAVYDSFPPGLHVPPLHVSIARADTGDPLELRRPPKRFFSASGGEKLVEQYLIAVPVEGMYEVRVAADEPTGGFLLIGDRPIDALAGVFRMWVMLAVVGFILGVGIAVALQVKRGKPTLSVALRVNRGKPE
jgi:hypothetical protein